MKKFFNEFKAFISKGSVIDLAVGVIIGTAFTAIVNSLVKDVFMPFITAITGTSFSQWIWVVNGVPAYLETGAINPDAIIVYYGNLIQNVFNFFIIAFVLFMFIRIFNRAKGFMPKFEGFTKEEYIKMRKEGMSKKQIAEKAKIRDEELAAKAKAEEEEKQRNSTEGLLKDIKLLLEDNLKTEKKPATKKESKAKEE